MDAMHPLLEQNRPQRRKKDRVTAAFIPIRLLTAIVIAIMAASPGAMGQAENKPGARLPTPAVLLEQITVDGAPHSAIGTSVSPSAVLNLGPGKHRIEFQYTSPGFESSEQIRYRFRLLGLDLNWVDAGNRRMASYSYLPPGNYLFQVIACNADGVWNQTGASIGLTIAKYFWQTWWFMGLLFATFLVLAGTGVRFIIKRNFNARGRDA